MTPVEDRLRDLRAATRSGVKTSPQLLSRIRETTARPRRLHDRLFKPWGLSKPGALAAATIAALAIVLSVFPAHEPVSHTPATKAQIRALAQQQPVPSSFMYRSAVADPGARRVMLSSPDGQTSVPVVVLPDGSAVLGVGDLALLGKGKTYQLWGIVGGSPVSLRVIGQNPDFETFTAPPTVTMLFMTVEDEGGVVTSAMAPVVSGSVNSLRFDSGSEDRLPNGSPRNRVV